MNYRIFFLLFFFIFSNAECLLAQTSQAGGYKQAVIVTAERRASEVGKQILQRGGNAVDAAVAVQFALAVTLPRAGNIGGGGFMVLHITGDKTIALDFREVAPAKATKNMFMNNGAYQPHLSRESVLASGVPGVVDGMFRAHERYSKLSWNKLLQPAIKLAKEGYRLSWVQAQELNKYAASFKKHEASNKYFGNSSQKSFAEGDLFIQKDLAKTLQRIARMGREGFYAGKTADWIIAEMEKQGGIISRKDLRDYKAIWRKPVQTTFHGYRLYIMPPPSSGSIAIDQILNMLRPYDLKKLEFNSAAYVHLITETMRRAFADRAYFMGDPRFVDIPDDTLLSLSYNKNRMQSFDWQKVTPSATVSHGNIPEFSESLETTHFSIVDKYGNAAAVTTTLNGNFGNKIAVDHAGFLLNNEMDDFTAHPGEPNMFGLIQGKANAIQPDKRMLSSMSPTIVTKDGKVRMVLGAAGGPRIINATLENFLNLSIFGMSARQAISAPRFHHQWMPDTLYYEQFGLSPDTQKLLQNKGHHLKYLDGIGRANIIAIDKKGIKHGASDPRGDGSVTGY